MHPRLASLDRCYRAVNGLRHGDVLSFLCPYRPSSHGDKIEDEDHRARDTIHEPIVSSVLFIKTKNELGRIGHLSLHLRFRMYIIAPSNQEQKNETQSEERKTQTHKKRGQKPQLSLASGHNSAQQSRHKVVQSCSPSPTTASRFPV